MIRLNTLENWTNKSTKENLGQAELVFIGESDDVICPFCQCGGC